MVSTYINYEDDHDRKMLSWFCTRKKKENKKKKKKKKMLSWLSNCIPYGYSFSYSLDSSYI